MSSYTTAEMMLHSVQLAGQLWTLVKGENSLPVYVQKIPWLPSSFVPQKRTPFPTHAAQAALSVLCSSTTAGNRKYTAAMTAKKPY